MRSSPPQAYAVRTLLTIQNALVQKQILVTRARDLQTLLGVLVVDFEMFSRLKDGGSDSEEGGGEEGGAEQESLLGHMLRLKALADILWLIRHKAALVIDEMDQVLLPRVELNLPMGRIAPNSLVGVLTTAEIFLHLPQVGLSRTLRARGAACSTPFKDHRSINLRIRFGRTCSVQVLCANSMDITYVVITLTSRRWRWRIPSVFTPVSFTHI